MAGRHPRDELGRVLPHPWWPADRQAPDELEFVRRFCNSTNRENGAERFGSAEGLDRWLISEGTEPVATSVSGMSRLVRVREALHDLVVANATGEHDPSAWDEFTEATRHVSFHLERHAAAVHLTASGSALDRLIGRIVAAVVEATHAGTFTRLKACRHCHWVVFDPSKNRSSRWCSMAACGGRHNARQYRQRNRSAR